MNFKPGDYVHFKGDVRDKGIVQCSVDYYGTEMFAFKNSIQLHLSKLFVKFKHQEARFKDYSMIYTVQAKLMPKRYFITCLLIQDLHTTEIYKFNVAYVVTCNLSNGVIVKHCKSEYDAILKYEEFLDYTEKPGVVTRQEFIDSLFDLN